ncbi:TPA: hypothetical protein JAV88_001600 [Raoultella ornithinolytica]|nr:hypothetical protein [Raoultella ornithinolytica]
MSELINETSNQHFISQSELRFNAVDPTRLNSLIKINRFRLVDRENHKVKKPEKKRIRDISCNNDIFTLAIIDSEKRINMEKFFRHFEDQYNGVVTNFLSAIKTKVDKTLAGTVSIDGSEFYSDIKFLQKIKFMNFLRNPHNIHTALETFDFAKDYIVHGTGGDFQLIINALLKNEKGQRDYICNTYGVTNKEFDSWIKLILLFVYHDEQMRNPVLDGMIEEFFRAKELYTAVIIGYYSEDTKNCPLIPDTGSIVYPDMTFYFNVSRNCFVTLKHLKLDSEEGREITKKALECMGEPFTEKSFECFKNIQAAKNFISIHINDEEILSGYNKICITESAQFVYSGSSKILGADVIQVREHQDTSTPQ